MTTATPSVLSDHAVRLNRLERQNRLLRAGMVVALLGLPLLALRGPARVEDEVRAKAFLLVDERGEVRARLHIEGGETPSFEMTDLDGKRRIDLYVKGPDAVVAMLDPDEHSRIAHAVDSAGIPHTVYFDDKQVPRLHLAVDSFGMGSLSCTGPSGLIEAGLGISAKTGPWLRPHATAPAAPAPTEPAKVETPATSDPDAVPPTGSGKKDGDDRR